MSAYDAALHIAQHSGLLKDLYEDKSIEGLNRYENIQELLNGIKEFSEREDIEDKGLDVFMQDIALLTNDDNDKNPDADTVSLMTIPLIQGVRISAGICGGFGREPFSHRRCRLTHAVIWRKSAAYLRGRNAC
jgi:hypothetical protein